MKRAYLPVLAMAAILLVLWLLKTTPLPMPSVATQDPKYSREPGLRAGSLAAGGRTASDVANPLTQLGLPLPPEVRPHLNRALKCAELAELERRRFPPDSEAYQTLGFLVESLFRDDFSYAALATRRLDASQARSAGERMGELLLTNEDLAMPDISTLPLPALDDAARRKFLDLYQEYLAPDNSEYGDVYKVLSASTAQDVLANDLLKDACLYVSLRSQVGESRAEEDQETQARLADLVAQIADPAQLAAATNSVLEIGRQKAAQWEQLEAAYRNIFAFRFQDRHGLNSETLFPELEKLTLGLAGPDVRTPE